MLQAGDGDSAAKDPSLSVDLDAVVEEILEGSNVHNLISHGLAAVDSEGLRLLLALGPGRGLLRGNCDRHCCGGCGASDEKNETLGSLWSCTRMRKESGRDALRALIPRPDSLLLPLSIGWMLVEITWNKVGW
jgi:hypothetical protein